jgi:molybdopterin converting factor small subunit
MPRVSFTANLHRHVSCPAISVEAATVGEALSHVFAASPALRGYVLDEQGAVRHHVVIFVDGRAISDRRALSDPVSPESEIYVFQALSGG